MFHRVGNHFKGQFHTFLNTFFSYFKQFQLFLKNITCEIVSKTYQSFHINENILNTRINLSGLNNNLDCAKLC